AMGMGERYNCLAREQGGGRYAHMAIESSLNLVLLNDDSRSKRKVIAICSNDAKGCFDRIVHSVAFICLRRFGIPQAPLVSMFQIIQKLKHHIRTAFGDSDATYGPHSYAGAHPNQGILQGNGAAGATWTAVSSVIVAVMKSLGFGYSSWTAISNAVIELVCSMFVDDADLVHSGKTNDTSSEEVATELQEALDAWDQLLRHTGGALEKDKSYWCLIDYTRSEGKWRYKSINATPGQLLLHNDATGLREPIERISPHTAKKALGNFTRPDGKMREEVLYLRKKACDWADSLRAKRIRKDDAWYCVNSSILRTIEYPLTATSFTKEQCAHIMAPILYAMLPTIKVQRNMPRVLVYAPERYQGGGVNDPRAIQLILHLHCILRHCSRPTPTGSFLCSNMENLTLELGSGTPFWDLDYQVWKHIVTPSWIAFTWSELQDTPLSLRGPLPRLLPQRQGDVFLMDVFMAQDYSPADLCSLNDVRMYKQVMRLSDIVTADGKELLDSALTATPPTRSTNITWPRCYRPKPNQITLWKAALSRCFQLPHVTHRKLSQPLGLWNHDCDRYWEWWYSPSNDILYHRSQDHWD
ncbi:MAG: hypothetical protein ACRCT2_09010, partial [Plesiomonas shigelloides]